MLRVAVACLLCAAVPALNMPSGRTPKAPSRLRDRGAFQAPGTAGWDPTARRPHRASRGTEDIDILRGYDAFSKRSPDTAGANMDKRYSGVDPVQAPRSDARDVAVGGDGATGDDTQHCIREAFRPCPLRVMAENFAAFTQCVVDHGPRFSKRCVEWAQAQAPCAADMVRLCGGKTPPETTQCLVGKEGAVSAECKETPLYTSMVDGFDAMQDRMASDDAQAPDADVGDNLGPSPGSRAGNERPFFMNPEQMGGQGDGAPGGDGGMPGAMPNGMGSVPKDFDPSKVPGFDPQNPGAMPPGFDASKMGSDGGGMPGGGMPGGGMGGMPGGMGGMPGGMGSMPGGMGGMPGGGMGGMPGGGMPGGGMGGMPGGMGGMPGGGMGGMPGGGMGGGMPGGMGGDL